MANYQSDNYTQIPHNGVYGNLSVAHAPFADISTINGNAGFANGDTFDIAKIPAGAKLISGFIYVGSQAIATSTIMVGVKYADGTSTGGTTGSAVLVAGTGSAITAAHTRYDFRFTQFSNEADMIVYGSWVSPGAPASAGGYPVDFVINYEAKGTK